MTPYLAEVNRSLKIYNKTYKTGGVNTNHFWLQIVKFADVAKILGFLVGHKKAELRSQLCSFGGND